MGTIPEPWSYMILWAHAAGQAVDQHHLAPAAGDFLFFVNEKREPKKDTLYLDVIFDPLWLKYHNTMLV